MIIFKYPISITDEQFISVPLVWKPLTVQMQHGGYCIWAEVDEDSKTLESVKIIIRGTGHPFNASDRGNYIGTVQTMSGLVWHVYYILLSRSKAGG